MANLHLDTYISETDRIMNSNLIETESAFVHRVANFVDQELKPIDWNVDVIENMYKKHLPDFGLKYSNNPDGICTNSNDEAVGLIEVKRPTENPDSHFKGEGAQQIIKEVISGNFTESDLKQLGRFVRDRKQKSFPSNSWKYTSQKNSAEYINVENIMSPSISYQLYQLDLNLLDLYYCESMRFVIWSNAIYWRIFKKQYKRKSAPFSIYPFCLCDKFIWGRHGKIQFLDRYNNNKITQKQQGCKLVSCLRSIR